MGTPLRGLLLAGPRRSGSTMPVMRYRRGGIFAEPRSNDVRRWRGAGETPGVRIVATDIVRSLADDEGAAKYTDSPRGAGATGGAQSAVVWLNMSVS